MRQKRFQRAPGRDTATRGETPRYDPEGNAATRGETQRPGGKRSDPVGNAPLLSRNGRGGGLSVFE